MHGSKGWACMSKAKKPKTKGEYPKVPKPLVGLAVGGFLGSMVPVVGTLVGAGVGAVVGGVMSLKNNKGDQGDQNSSTA
ncbi:hypothetical protein NHP200010_00520 [Helicobacter bizzozeronii]|uniref:glycine zipper domain-containing protein n=2 Tax=Helicobacter bizzozeronii TaxID=56877 RepID=UPI00244D8AF4|nr:glycine zipper domain-containing protein [Helicobacter bizzozeronii]GMB92341.1 hypothetical protein NHP200010_00520 [Helicobacter bizzozeronii]